MQTLLSVVRRHLTEQGYRPEKRSQGLRASIQGCHGMWYLSVQTNEDDRWLICRSILPTLVPAELRRQVGEFITRTNYGLILGGYEMDMDDGEVAYKTSIRLAEDELTDGMVKELLLANFSTFDRVLPGFLAIVFGRRSVRHAMKASGQPMPDANAGPVPEPTALQDENPPLDEPKE